MDDQANQREIEDLRAQRQAEFDRIEGLMPSPDEMQSLSIEPPHELLHEDWKQDPKGRHL